MPIAEYLAGCGLDVSKNNIITTAEHLYIEPDNLYRLESKFGVECFDYLYAKGIINQSKYYRILLYEWFLVVKKGGYIILEFEENEILDVVNLKKEIASLVLYRNAYCIIEESIQNKNKAIIIKKTASIQRDANEINQWSFGVVTNGKRKEYLEKTITSIRALNIPEYEIIFCGTYHGEVDNDIRYISFTEHDDKGWITKKKNLICQHAKYTNIVVVHDRINFDKCWFEGVKKWGNYFDVLGGPIAYPTEGVTQVNWDTMGFRSTPEMLKKASAVSAALDPSDWDQYAIIGGPVIILKKYIWELEKWKETLFWGEWEDVELSHRQSDSGILLRFNPYAKFISEIMTVPLVKIYYEKDSKHLGRLQANLVFLVGIRLLDLFGCKRDGKLIRWISVTMDRIFKSRNWKREAKIVNGQS